MEMNNQSEYRKFMWEKSQKIIKKVSDVIDIEKVILLGSFTTKKERPADVDFIVMVKTKDKGDWSTDIQFVPSNEFGEDAIDDAKKWMEEKYGKNNYEVIELNIDEIKNNG